jgi:hypothetical protein
MSVGNARVIGSRRRLPLTAAAQPPSVAHHVASSQSTTVFFISSFFRIHCLSFSFVMEAKNSSTPIRPIYPFLSVSEFIFLFSFPISFLVSFYSGV